MCLSRLPAFIEVWSLRHSRTTLTWWRQPGSSLSIPESLRRLIKQKKVPAVLFAGKYLIDRDTLNQFKANYDPRPGRKAIRRLL